MKKLLVFVYILFVWNNLFADNQKEPYKGWLETETEHFRIIYEEMSVDSVIEITGFCDDVYNSVTTFFDSYPEKIVLVIHDRIDVSNGSFYPAPPHINMYVSPPSTPEFGAKVDNWLRFLLIHELTHYVNMTIEKGIFYGLSRVLGKSISSIPGGLMPGWAIEGIAVKLESDFTDGGRGNNPFFEMYSKALIIEDKLFSWRQAAYNSYHPPTSRIYVAGFIINDYMARTYENDIFVKIYREFLKFPLLGFNHYVEKITGDSIRDIFNSMEIELKQKYPNIDSVSDKLLSPDNESNYYLPVITNAGWIMYRESENQEPALILFDPESSKEKVLIKTTLSDNTSYSATKDGSEIFFTSLNIKWNHPAGLNATSDLYSINSGTGKIQKITTNAHLRQPAVSPRGQRLVAVQKNGQYTQLVEVNIETGHIDILFAEHESYVFNPSFSSEGNQVVFTVQKKSGRKLYILDSQNNLKFPGSDFKGDIYNPIFVESDNIIFVSDIDGIPALYKLEMGKEKSISKLYSNPVGIFSGLQHDNNIIYSTYSPRGYTLRTVPYIKPSSIETGIKFQKLQKQENSSSVSQNISFESYKEYTDLPKLVAFTPIPFYINPLYESSQIFGPGITGYFRSILGKSEIFSTLTLDTGLLQPGASFDFTYNWGPVGLSYSLLQGYSERLDIYDAHQTTRQQLIFNLPVINEHNLGLSTYFGFFTGFADNYTISSDKDFPFFSPSSDSNTDYKNETFQITGFAYSLSGQKSRGDTFQPFNINSSTFLYTPVSNNFLKQYAVKSTNSINIPSPIDHQVFKFSGRLTYSEIPNLQYLNSPRGFSVSGDSDFNILTSVEYLFTAAKPDWPILGGLSLQGISGTIHLEKIITLENEKLVPDKNYYGGMEMILLGNYIYAFESAGIGVSYRFEPNTSAFNSTNLGIYLFIGTNSFN